MNGCGESFSNGALWDTRRPPSCIIALPGMGALLGGPFNSPSTHWTSIDSAFVKFQVMESSTPGDSSKGSKEGSDTGELLCSEAPHGATGQNPGSASLESLTEKVGTLGLQGRKKNRCGAAKRWTSRARRAEVPMVGIRLRPDSAASKRSTAHSAKTRYIWNRKRDYTNDWTCVSHTRSSIDGGQGATLQPGFQVWWNTQRSTSSVSVD
jgi:hypothetical protein